jgi:hypothetical protein
MITNTEVATRESLIGALRTELASRANGEMSICKLAAQTGIFCKGFGRYSDAELKRRFGWIVKGTPSIKREELEEVADRWQLARQDVDGVATACDVQQMEHDMCGGWDDFSNEQLSTFMRELTGRSVEVPTE